MDKVVATLMVALVLAGGAYAQAASGTEACQGLARLELKDAKVVSAETVPAGAFTPPANTAPWMAGDPSSCAAGSSFSTTAGTTRRSRR